MKEIWTKGPLFVRDLDPTQDGRPYFIVQAGGQILEMDGWYDEN